MSAYLHNPALVPPGTAPATRPGQVGGAPAPVRDAPVKGPSFADRLRDAQKTEGLQFSGHAIQRLQRRGIEMGGATLERLQDGVARAASKGARDSVVFVDGTAFVVSVKNKTVITAVDPEHMRQHVFTNIDSAVIA